MSLIFGRWLPTALMAALMLGLGAGPGLAVDDEAILAAGPPKSLAAFGFFADLAAQAPAEGVLPYRLNTPLFSDHAVKLRFVYVPAGKAASYDAEEAFSFPVGSALIKTFAFPGGSGGPGHDLRLIETRVLLKTEAGWQAWPYLWNADHTDAVLKVTGAKVGISLAAVDGKTVDFTYSVPNKNQCKGCHALDGEVTPIGPKARNLNGDFRYRDGARNQLGEWASAGILSGAPDPGAAPGVPDWSDADADLDRRARAWLDVNCAHCHRRGGAASNSGLFLTWHEQDPVALGIMKRPVAAGRGSGGRLFDIAPGDPDGSILMLRVESTEPGVMMPELGRSLEDEEAVELLRRWIATMR
ncbi:MAG: SO2930 family diheme c-type cytochrome [Rhizobiaceae bacterium]